MSTALVLALLFCVPLPQRAQGVSVTTSEDGVPRAQVSELRGLSRVKLVVSRMLHVDTSGAARAVFDELFTEGAIAPPRYEYAYDIVARRFEKYAAEGLGVQLVETVAEADFVVAYKVVKLIDSFAKDEPFVYGEMFVFVNRTTERAGPALVWQTKSELTPPDDAVRDFVKQLRAVRAGN